VLGVCRAGDHRADQFGVALAPLALATRSRDADVVDADDAAAALKFRPIYILSIFDLALLCKANGKT